MSVVSSPTKIAFFGPTGGTGRATLRSLLDNQHLTLHLQLFVRSKSRLFKLFPELQSRPGCHVWEGELTSIDTIKECLSGANIIICTLGENQNIPGCNVLRPAAKSIVRALETLRLEAGGEWRKPRMLLLSSSTWNPQLAKPGAVLWIIKTAFHYPYADLLEAQRIIEESNLVSLLLVQPPAIVDEPPSGYKISTTESAVACSYADLGAAFAEMATERGYDKLNAVGVTSRGGTSFKKYAPEILSRVFVGLLAGYMPGYWPIKRMIGRLW